MLAWLKKVRPEQRNYSDAILTALETAVAKKTANAASSAAIESVSGLLARSVCAAKINAPDWVKEIITPLWLQQATREMLRNGEHLSIIISVNGQIKLCPASDWTWSGSFDESGWSVRASLFGPSSNQVREVNRESAVFLRWSRLALEPGRGRSPTALAALTSSAAAETERALAEESSGAVAQLLATPEGSNVASNTGQPDPLANIRAAVAKARGKTLIIETTGGGYGDAASAPKKDWAANRLGPKPPAELVQLAADTFDRFCAVCGASPALFKSDSDGTSQRESLRRWHLTTVLPVARLLENELSTQLQENIGFEFDLYPTDLAGRALSFQKLVASGMSIDKAIQLTGLML